MSKTPGLVSKIIRFSVVDGPGNRLAVFLQGCNFNCINCHNPHTIGLCTGCGMCVVSCPGEALRVVKEDGVPHDTVHYDPSRCLQCDRCITVCPFDSNPRVRRMTVDEVLTEVRMVKSFISGITVSGGEATRQTDFVHDLFRAVKDDPQLRHLTTFLDTNGSTSHEDRMRLLPVTDGVMVDLKALDAEVHRRLTGAENDTVLRSLEEWYAKGRLYEVRLLLIPGYNLTPEQLHRTAGYLAGVCPHVRIRLIAFRRHGVRQMAESLREPEREEMEKAREILRNAGFTEVIVT